MIMNVTSNQQQFYQNDFMNIPSKVEQAMKMRTAEHVDSNYDQSAKPVKKEKNGVITYTKEVQQIWSTSNPSGHHFRRYNSLLRLNLLAEESR